MPHANFTSVINNLTPYELNQLFPLPLKNGRGPTSTPKPDQVRFSYIKFHDHGNFHKVWYNYRLMQVKSTTECSKGSILQNVRPSFSYQLLLRSLFCLILSGRFTHVLLYCKRRIFIVYIEGSQVTISKNVFYSMKIEFVLANNADPDETPPHAAGIHLGLHCLQK